MHWGPALVACLEVVDGVVGEALEKKRSFEEDECAGKVADVFLKGDALVPDFGLVRLDVAGQVVEESGGGCLLVIFEECGNAQEK